MSKPKEQLMPPDYLIREWDSEYCYNSANPPGELHRFLCSKAAQWGADQELEACCEWLDDNYCDDPQDNANELRAARRPKPLKQQALEEFDALMSKLNDVKNHSNHADRILRALEVLSIRRALEALPYE